MSGPEVPLKLPQHVLICMADAIPGLGDAIPGLGDAIPGLGDASHCHPIVDQ